MHQLGIYLPSKSKSHNIGGNFMKFKALAVALVLTVSLLAGCTSDKDAEAPAPESTDVATTASIVAEDQALETALSTEGTWIVAILNDVTTDKELVIDGDFHNKGDEAQDLYRKVALYAQDADRNVTAEYTLTAPKLTVKSPNAKIVNGTFVGDVYVEAEGFTLSGTTIDGNVYFASEELKAGFTMDNEAAITGKTVVAGTDVVSTASIVISDTDLESALAADGNWIIAILNNVSTAKELVIEGDFHDKNDAKLDLYRKLALYAQDADRNITAEYTLTAPKLTVKSPNTKIVNGTFVGDVYVEAEGFTLSGTTIDGNVYFATEEVEATFVNENESTVTGVTEVSAN